MFVVIWSRFGILTMRMGRRGEMTTLILMESCGRTMQWCAIEVSRTSRNVITQERLIMVVMVVLVASQKLKRKMWF